MRAISKEELEAAIAHRSPGERISFREVEIWNMDLTGTDLSNMEFELSSFQNTVLDHVNLENSSVENALFDGCSLHGANFTNANLKTASFRYCDLRESNIEGANPSCRCNKAKVLTIKSFDFKENYEEAWSLVDENFVYRRGQWVKVKDFNEDRWQDSTTGIHFWMTRQEAENY